MNRREQRLFMILGILGVALIVTTIGIQYLNSEIEDVNNKKILKQGRVNNDALLLNNYYQLYLQFVLYDILDADLVFYKESEIEEYMSDEIKDVYNDYFEENISDEELILKVNDLIWTDIETKHLEYITHHYELENITYGDLKFWKGVLTYYLQIPIIVFTVFGYAYIYIGIKGRETSDTKPKSKRKSRK